MRRTRQNFAELSDEDKRILDNKTITPDVASFMVDMSMNSVVQYRYRVNHREECKQASQKCRNKMKAENQKRFGGNNKCYNYWSEAEIEYILFSNDSDKTMAKKLHRTVYAIQKKRERELHRRENGS